MPGFSLNRTNKETKTMKVELKKHDDNTDTESSRYYLSIIPDPGENLQNRITIQGVAIDASDRMIPISIGTIFRLDGTVYMIEQCQTLPACVGFVRNRMDMPVALISSAGADPRIDRTLTLLENLERNALSYCEAGNLLVLRIRKVEETLERQLPPCFTFTHGPIKWHSEFATSNRGSFGPTLAYIDDHRSRPIPDKWEDAGKSEYLHGDYNVCIDYATRDEILEVASALPEFLEALNESLRAKASEATEAKAMIEAAHVTDKEKKQDD